MPTAPSPDGATVHYHQAGSGPGVVLVHGVAGDAEAVWAPLVDRLADRYTVVAPDLSGTSRTQDAGGAISLDTLVLQVLTAADAAGLRQFDLVAYSFGAPVALKLAAHHPDRVRSLLLVAPWAKTDARQAFFFDTFARAFRSDRELTARVATFSTFSPAFFEQAGAEGAGQVVGAFTSILAPGTDRQAESAAAVDVTDDLPDVRARTLVVGLTHDLQVPVEHARRLAADLPDAEIIEVATGHALPWEDGDRFQQLIDDHLTARRVAA